MRRRLFARWLWLSLPLLIVLAHLAGCGGGSSTQGNRGEVGVAEEALNKALHHDNEGFISLVAPSFLEDARREMPDADDQVLGAVLIAGFLEQIPFDGIIEAHYSFWEYEQAVVVYVWGRFSDAGGEIDIDEADAVGIPLVLEDGRWYVDLLNL